MFRLDRHIELLLLRCDCVILPGFGGFVKHRVSARAEGSRLLPPMETAGFNAQLTMNDSLLVQSYVEAYDYSFPEALSVVESEIEQLRAKLREDGQFEFRSVGVLTLAANGKLEFEPSPAGIANPSLFGLAPVDTARSECFLFAEPEVIVQEKNDSAASKENAFEETSEVPVNIDEIETSEEELNGEYVVIKIPRKALRWTAAACIALMIVASIPFIGKNVNTHALTGGINFDSIENLFTRNGAPQSSVEVATTTVSSAAELASGDASSVEPSSEDVSSEKTDSVAANANKDCFTVVLAARVSATNARRFVEHLAEGGITAEQIGEGKDLRVVSGRYATLDEAQQARRALAKNSELADAWVTALK
ncbi:MAG: SPOR domain-containing protein [Prevotella sp.]|nr:SPOR domain-containing protein [Prevotella sp.]